MKLKQRYTKSFTKKEYDENKKVIIYGAGNYGELAWGGLKEIGIEPYAFMDMNHSGEIFHDLQVISPGQIDIYKDDIILIASLNYFGEIISFLNENNVSSFYDIEELIKICPIECLNEYALDEKNNIQKYSNVINSYKKDGLIIGHVEIVVTEKCTLRCKDCANLMQYYTKPEDIDIDDIIFSFDHFLTLIDTLVELRILGGEPFIVKNIDKLINYYANNDKIKRITIYTNSTIVPSENIINALKNNKVSVHMSDYGKVSKNIIDLEEIFRHESITFYIHKYYEWNDLGDCSKRKYTYEQLCKFFSECNMAKCYTFYRGKLFLCPRSAHGERLGYFKNNISEYMDFSMEISNIEMEREKIKRLLKNVKSLTACNYCNGSNLRSKKIESARQLNKNDL